VLSVACCDLWGHAVLDGGALAPTAEQVLADGSHWRCGDCLYGGCSPV